MNGWVKLCCLKTGQKSGVGSHAFKGLCNLALVLRKRVDLLNNLMFFLHAFESIKGERKKKNLEKSFNFVGPRVRRKSPTAKDNHGVHETRAGLFNHLAHLAPIVLSGEGVGSHILH